MDTNELMEKANKSILYTSKKPDIIMQKGKGMYLWDTEGKKYLDFMGGWAVTCLGHCPDVMKEALINQGSELINASPAFYNTPLIKFADLLIQISAFDRVFFTSTGAEANEGAIKLARKYGAKKLNGAYEIITTINGFHGRTLATMSATGKKVWEKLYAPKIPGFIHVPFNDIDAVKKAINKNTCAVMLEPIQGEGGVNVANVEYIKELRSLCDQNGVLLIFDEIQTGIGRTGKMFAYEHYDIVPDIMTLAKGIGGGYPLAAMLTREELNIFEPGDQGGTYTNQPLGMAVGYAVVKEILGKNILENVNIQGDYIVEGLNGIKNEFGFKDIRGKGLLIAVDLPCDNAVQVVNECLEDGLLLNAPKPHTLRIMPPLIVSKEDTDEMLKILNGVLKKVAG
ncbi:aspartate aminotransferase family protein [Acetivibrio cellulolyticus]|uniref:aspartate aminotransferase family protein n=1 Tax=Acetivibrio cellulolyticus TaxID=35830 RepID=UPI0001E2EBEF|nr:acetylornithine/succinylornithine family transaminase [Acetivibrio cellulolyticus]